MPPISFLIKPASGSCNMRCKYCFYADEQVNREIQSYGMMTLETMHRIVDKGLAFADGAAPMHRGRPSAAKKRVLCLQLRSAPINND